MAADMGLEALKRLVAKDWPTLSESDTRSKIIDPMFKSVLGWSEEDIAREEHNSEGFVDYIFSSNRVRHFVVEAKNNKTEFEVPPTYPNRQYKINGVISTEKPIIRAIEQARQYAVANGTRFAIVTNGSQYIIFEAFRYNSDWREGKCIVFRSFEDIVSNFMYFWRILNKVDVIDGSLQKLVSNQPEILEFRRPLDFAHIGDNKNPRNRLYQLLEPFAEKFFGEMITTDTLPLLKDCYIYDRFTRNAEDSLKPYFLGRIRQLREDYNVESFVETESSAGHFEELFLKSEKLLQMKTPESKVMVLLGGVGAGKTTFLHRFFKVVLEDREDMLWFYVDCRRAPLDVKELEKFIFQEIIKEYRSKYQTRLYSLLTKAGIEDVDANYRDIVSLFGILRSNNYSTTLVLDNIDQHIYVTASFQEQIFLEAENLLALRAIEIVSLREESFFKSTLKGSFTAYNIKPYEIIPPPFEELIRKRLDYVINLLQSSDELIQKTMGIEPPSTGQREQMVKFLQIVKDSIFRERTSRSAIAHMMTEISKGDMRQALKFFVNYLSSGNTKVEEMLVRHDQSGQYIIQYHMFLKSMVLGDRRYYTSDSTNTMNLFETNPIINVSHFLHLRVLKYASDRASQEGDVERGMIDINSLEIEAEKVGISKQSLDYCLNRLFKFGLVEFETGQQTAASAKFYRVTPTGDYYLMILARRFAYVDLVWQDTPISDLVLAKKLGNGIDFRSIESRISRVTDFLDYLTEQEKMEFVNHPEYDDFALTRPRFMKAITNQIVAEEEHILRVRDANYDADTSRS